MLCVLKYVYAFVFIWPAVAQGGASVGQSMSDATCLLGQGQGWCYYVTRLGKDLWPSVDWDRWTERRRGQVDSRYRVGKKDKDHGSLFTCSHNNNLNNHFIWISINDCHACQKFWLNLIFLKHNSSSSVLNCKPCSPKVIDVFGHLGSTKQAINSANTGILSPYKGDMVNLLANISLFIYSADTLSFIWGHISGHRKNLSPIFTLLVAAALAAKCSTTPTS